MSRIAFFLFYINSLFSLSQTSWPTSSGTSSTTTPSRTAHFPCTSSCTPCVATNYPQSLPFPLPIMRNIHSEALREQVKSGSAQSPILEVLNLVKPIIHKMLVVQRRRRCQPHDKIPTSHPRSLFARFLLQHFETSDLHDGLRGGNLEPIRSEIQLNRSQARKIANVCLGAHLRQKAGLFSQTASDLRLAGRHQGKRASLEGRNASYTLTQEASERHCGRTRFLSRKMTGRMKRLDGSRSNSEGMR